MMYFKNKSPIINIYHSSVVDICAISIQIICMGYSGSLLVNNGGLGGVILTLHFWHVSYVFICC